MKSYVMSSQVLARYRSQTVRTITNNLYLTCRVCGEPIFEGEPTISTASNSKAKQYHKGCYEGTLH